MKVAQINCFDGLQHNPKLFSLYNHRMIGAKIVKSGGGEPDEFEKQIGQALLELELNSDLKPTLRELYITRAREVEFGNKKVRRSDF
jgi:Ribosomal protein S7e